MTRIAILAPVVNSPFSRSVLALCLREPGIEVVGVLCRRILNPARLRAELRRDGARLARKAWRKLVLAEADDSAAGEEGFHDLASRAGVGKRSLKRLASDAGVPFRSVDDHNAPESIDALRAMRPDVVAFTGGGIIRQPLIEASGLGIFNTHMGPLPEYRGMDVVEWPILEADGVEPVLGVTLHFMDRGIDTGPIVKVERVPIHAGDRMERLRKRFEPVMVSILMEGIRLVRDGALEPRPQAEADGRQYFVMHPRLYAEARRRLAILEADR